MKNFIKRMPMSIGGLCLGIVSLGNLLGGKFGPILALISAILTILFAIKILIYNDLVTIELKNTIGASVAPTFAMALVMLSRYIALFINHKLGLFTYCAAIFLHLVLIIYFSNNYYKFINSREIYGSFMIVYGSFAAGAIVAPFFDRMILGKIIWAFGFIGFLPLLFMVIIKDIKSPELDEAKMPLYCVTAANGGLLLTGYFNSFTDYNTFFIIFMIILGQVVYFRALLKLKSYLKLNFYPSFSSFTFPFVINATALKMTVEYFITLGYNLGLLNYLVYLEIGVAIILVAYVFIMYLRYLATEKTTRFV